MSEIQIDAGYENCQIKIILDKTFCVFPIYKPKNWRKRLLEHGR